MQQQKLRLLWLTPWFITRRFLFVRGIDRSASLAYVTLLSLVPMLATVALLYRSFFELHTDRLVELITLVLPYSPGNVQQHLAGFVREATTIGGISSLVFLFVGFRLYLSIETTLNEVWCVTTRRSPAIRMFSFTMVVFWGPVVMGVGSSALVWAGTQPWAPSSAFLLDVGRWAVPLLGLTMVYWLAPHTGVHIGSALLGGVMVTLGLQGLRAGMLAYVRTFPDINVIYGTLGLVIIFLVSLFAFWTLVIIGAVTSFVAQNLPVLLLEHDGGAQLEGDPALTALAFLTECFQQRQRADGRSTIESIASHIGITHSAARQAAECLLETGLVAVTGRGRDGYVPSREAANLSIAAALRDVRTQVPVLPGHGTPFDELGSHLAAASEAQQQVLEQVSFADLLDEPEPAAATVAEPDQERSTGEDEPDRSDSGTEVDAH